MKKILFIFVLLALVLLVPIPQQKETEERNSVVYNAILYSVEKVEYLDPDNLGEEEYFVQGYIVKILGIEVYNSVTQQ